MSLTSLIKNYLHNNNNFIKNIAILSGGSALAQLLPVLVFPLLSRLYSPEDFGVFTVFSAALTMFSVVGCLRYEMAITLAATDEEAINILFLCFLISFFMTFCCFSLLYYFGDFLGYILNVFVLKDFYILLPVSLAGFCSYQALSYWSIREKKFDKIATAKISQNFFLVMIQLGYGVLHSGPLGLFLGIALGRWGGNFTLLCLSWKNVKNNIHSLSTKKLLEVTYKFKRFPLFSTLASFFHYGSNITMPFVLSALYENSVAGWFGFALRVSYVPLVLVGQAVAQVYWGEASTRARDDPTTFKTFFFSTVKNLILTATVPLLLIVFLAPRLFSLLFGASWEMSGYYLQVLSLAIFCQFIFGPIVQSLEILEKQRWRLVWEVIGFLLLIALLFIVYYHDLPAIYAVLSYSISISITYCGLFILSWLAISKL